ncbi:tRNA pseudouridine(38-40) synthase TruA [Sutterella sp.]|uniref:tRNA pseudouridine(38-40) synthase TruA n=1 Tax=Sutterella sp. TaxID=1981025 RepID=UPI0026DF9C74|nr:tRNA pseudouridine(38-40) synthase TruA [Sutterella sp.]MDO5531777.1 tRNA pseudouridine(38-40) synthase TruA [Sutterella sp.]
MTDSRTLALGIEYCGTAFNGWQVQPDRPSVQSALEEALSRFADHPVKVLCAGRTDAGVHATHQVVSFTTSASRAPDGWIRGVNAFLPRTVAVRWVRAVPDDFHARFSARSRTYEYWIWNDPVRSPIHENATGWVFRPLAVERMREGAQALVGEHDFTSFRAAECQAKSPVRTVTELSLIRQGDLVGVRISANAFLQHMVRNIVGALIYVGTGREAPGWIAEVLAARRRDVAAPTFSPSGLYLTGVGYPENPELPQRGRSPFGGVF